MKTLHPPRLARWLLSRVSARDADNDALGDFHEEYARRHRQTGRAAASRWYWQETLSAIGPYTWHHGMRTWEMTRNAFKTAIRNFSRHRSFALINLAGLGLGLACALMILYYVDHELGFDSYHPDADRIYRVALAVETASGTQGYAINSPPLGPTLQTQFPQVEAAARVFLWFNDRVVKQGDRLFEETGFVYADNSLFQILSMPFVEGDPATALAAPQSLVIPRRLAVKYFGAAPALGQTLNLDGVDYHVTGVVRDAADNTHLPVDLFLSLKDIENLGWMQDWTWPGMWTYVKLQPHSDAAVFARAIETLADAHVAGDERVAGKRYRNVLQPLRSLYLDSKMEYEFLSGSRFNLILFAAIGLFILVVACVNFINLTTARAATRTREIGLRKVAGATRAAIARQFMGEAGVLTLAALVLAVLILFSAPPLFHELTGYALNLSRFLSAVMLGWVALMTVAVGLLAGLYPALSLSRLTPLAVFRQASPGSTRSVLRRLLVILQFGVAIVLMVSALGVHRQLNHVRKQGLGFDKRGKLVLAVRGRRPLEANYPLIKAAFAGLEGVESVSATAQVPGTGAGSLQTRLLGQEEAHARMMSYYFFDADFQRQLGIRLVAGRGFDESRSTDKEASCLINETAVKALGFTSADQVLGWRLQSGLDGEEKEIIGVTADFHYRDLRNAIEPLVMEFNPSMFGTLVLSVKPGGEKQTLALIEAEWRRRFPDKPFQFRHLVDIVDGAYGDEGRQGRLLAAFALIGTAIACLGVLGLSAFLAQRRRKEMAIRKVLGGSTASLLGLLSREFSLWVVVSNGLAWPVAWLVLNRWLQTFYYRAPMAWDAFLLAGGVALALVWIIALTQSLRSARINPALDLKAE